MKFTNTTDIPLVLAVWLASNNGYDLEFDPAVISATTLMKPARSIILGRRIEAEMQSVDIQDLLQAKLGSAVHTAVEEAWLYHREEGLRNLGVPDHVISRIHLNPDPDVPLPEDAIIIHMEQRTNREVDTGSFIWNVSGKFDFVVQGTVEDLKTTKTFNWIKGSNNEKYSIQGSVYRWLNPNIITGDHINILMVFTDWSPLKAKVDSSYPQKRVVTLKLPLMSLEATESWVLERLRILDRYMDVPQEDLPLCTPDELWMDPPKWAYYKDPTKLARASSLHDTAAEAQGAMAKNGGKGLIVKRDMEPTFCRFCPARPACTQAEGYIAQGILQV